MERSTFKKIVSALMHEFARVQSATIADELLSPYEFAQDWVLAPTQLANIQQVCGREGVDTSSVTASALRHACRQLGWLPDRRQHTFADMLDCIKQHAQGLLTDGELIFALQCSSRQVQALSSYKTLPFKVVAQVSLADWDEWVETCEAKDDPWAAPGNATALEPHPAGNPEDIVQFILESWKVHHQLVVFVGDVKSLIPLAKDLELVGGVSVGLITESTPWSVTEMLTKKLSEKQLDILVVPSSTRSLVNQHLGPAIRTMTV
jgi:hypothetical protein